MAQENDNKVITLGNLRTFFNGLKLKFLSKTDASVTYAGINGSGNQNFNAMDITASTVSVGNGNTKIKIATGIKSVPDMYSGMISRLCMTLSCGDYSITIPLDGSYTASLAQLDRKSNAVEVSYGEASSERLSIDQIPQVFSRIITGSALNQKVEGVVGEIVYFNPIDETMHQNYNVFSNQRKGFYFVTNSIRESSAILGDYSKITGTKFLCEPSEHMLYYCLAGEGTKNAFYRYMFQELTAIQIQGSGSSQGEGGDQGDDYTTTTDEEITDIIKGLNE